MGHSTSVSTAVISATGFNAPGSLTQGVESWDGTSWTEKNNVNTARYYVGGAGTQASMIIFGGYFPPTRTNIVEQWNGTSWTEVADLTQSKYGVGGCGTFASALAAAGALVPGSTTECEEWSGAPVAVHTVTTS